jgi:hypothetical protein
MREYDINALQAGEQEERQNVTFVRAGGIGSSRKVTSF